MCGYVYDASTVPPTYDDIMAQYHSVEGRIDGSVVKIFTSGSFFDVHGDTGKSQGRDTLRPV